jgi:hypothetical protein
MLFRLHPEVAGGWGPETEYLNEEDVAAGRADVPEIRRFQYEFEGWLEDELLEAFPCFIVTAPLAETMAEARLTGMDLDDVEVLRSAMFEEIYPDRELPEFRRLISAGRVRTGDEGTVEGWTGHDLSLDQAARLVVTGAALRTLRRHQLKHCDVDALVHTTRG